MEEVFAQVHLIKCAPFKAARPSWSQQPASSLLGAGCPGTPSSRVGSNTSPRAETGQWDLWQHRVKHCLLRHPVFSLFLCAIPWIILIQGNFSVPSSGNRFVLMESWRAASAKTSKHLFHALGSFHPLLALGSVGLPTAPQPYLLAFLLRIWRQHSQNPHVIPRLRAATSQLTEAQRDPTHTQTYI